MNMKLKLALLQHPEPQYVVAKRMAPPRSETWLSRVVQERIKPTSEERGQLACILGVEAEELFGQGPEDTAASREQEIADGAA